MILEILKYPRKFRDLQFFRLQIWIRDSNKFIIWNFIWIICKERKIKFLKSKIWQLPFKDIEYLEIVKVQLTSYFASRKTYFEFEQKQKFIKILIFDKKQKKKDYSSFENLTIFQQIFIDPRIRFQPISTQHY